MTPTVNAQHTANAANYYERYSQLRYEHDEYWILIWTARDAHARDQLGPTKIGRTKSQNCKGGGSGRTTTAVCLSDDLDRDEITWLFPYLG